MKLKNLVPYFIIIFLASFILLNNYQKPLTGHHDWNSVYYGNIARNYLKLGLASTRLGQATSSGLMPTDLHYYTHYPPMLPLSLTLSYKILGVSDFSTRLVPIIFSIFILLLIFSIARQLKLSKLASLSTVLVSFTPMYRYFGKMADQESLLIAFTLWSLLLYIKLQKNPTKKTKNLFYLSVILNALTAWAGYFLYPILLIHSLIFNKKLTKIIIKSITLLIIVFALHLFHTFLLTGSFSGGGLFDALLLRLGISHLRGETDPSLRQYTLQKYLIQQARWITIYFTQTLLVAGGLTLSLLGFKIKQLKKFTLIKQVILILLLWALTYPIIFSNVVFIHEYFNFFFLPFLSLSLAWLINKIQAKSEKIAIILFFVVGGLIFFERLSFYQALEKTQAHQSGYKLGSLINQITNVTDSSLIIASRDYLGNQEPFIKFYADRAVMFSIYDPPGWQATQAENLLKTDYVFTVTFNQPKLFIDQALATQSAIIKQTDQFNAYQL